MIGQALSAVMLGFTTGNSEKIAISGVTRRRREGRRVVKAQIHEGKTVNFLLSQGCRTALRTRTTHHAKDETFAWLVWYNQSRLHSTLNYVSPMQFEQQWLTDQAKQAQS